MAQNHSPKTPDPFSLVAALSSSLTLRPSVEAVDRGHFIGPLDKARADKGPRRAKVDPETDAILHDGRTFEELRELCTRLLGKREMVEWGARWTWRARTAPKRLAEVLKALREAMQSQEPVRRRGAYAERLWQSLPLKGGSDRKSQNPPR